MEYFIQTFGGITVEKVAIFIAAIVFLAAVYKKVEKYISEKAIRDMQKEERIQKVIDQAEQYPAWHQQSIDIRASLDGDIKSLGNKLDAVNKALKEMQAENNENKAMSYRYRILRFDDEIRHGTKHSKEHFDQIVDDVDKYDAYCRDHPDYENNKAILAIENIKATYKRCANEHTFL